MHSKQFLLWPLFMLNIILEAGFNFSKNMVRQNKRQLSAEKLHLTPNKEKKEISLQQFCWLRRFQFRSRKGTSLNNWIIINTFENAFFRWNKSLLSQFSGLLSNSLGKRRLVMLVMKVGHVLFWPNDLFISFSDGRVLSNNDNIQIYKLSLHLF